MIGPEMNRGAGHKKRLRKEMEEDEDRNDVMMGVDEEEREGRKKEEVVEELSKESESKEQSGRPERRRDDSGTTENPILGVEGERETKKKEAEKEGVEDKKKRVIKTSRKDAKRKPTKKESKLLFAMAMGIAVKLVLQNHCYTVNGKIFHQKEKGIIGLDLQRSLARVYMGQKLQDGKKVL